MDIKDDYEYLEVRNAKEPTGNKLIIARLSAKFLKSPKHYDSDSGNYNLS